MSDSVRFHQMHLIGTGLLDKVSPWPQSTFSVERHAALQTTENQLFTLPQLAHLLTKRGRKWAENRRVAPR